ncbi:MAG: hypothetical protein WAK01_00755 [Methylocystis sp.]
MRTAEFITITAAEGKRLQTALTDCNAAQKHATQTAVVIPSPEGGGAKA